MTDADTAWMDEVVRLNEIEDSQERLAAREALHLEWDAEIRRDEAKLVPKLQWAGLDVTTTYDLVRDDWAKMNLAAARILIDQFPSIASVHLRMIVGRALEAKVVREVWDEVTALYRAEAHPWVRERLAAALMLTAGAKQLPGLIELARDRTRGSSRVLFVPRIRRLARDRAIEILTELAQDPQLEREARFQLAKLAKR